MRAAVAAQRQMLHRHQRVIRLFGEPQHPSAVISDRTGPSLVFRLPRITLIDPVENPAAQIEDAAEPDRAQELGGSCASRAHHALHYYLVIRAQLIEPLRDISARYQLGSRNPVDLLL